MKALVYNGPGSREWKEVPDPVIQDPEDAIVRVDAVTICGTDLHILRGDVPTVERGRTLGHEAVGTVQTVGSAVTGLRPGDRVLISCISSPWGNCRFCREVAMASVSMASGLDGVGWILGHTIDGTQEDALLFADIFPTSYEVGVLNGRVAPGDTVVIVGAGPIGLAAIATCRLMSPLHIVVVDPAASRRGAARLAGASVTMGPDEDV